MVTCTTPPFRAGVRLNLGVSPHENFMPDTILTLLQQIAENTSRDDSLWIAGIAGGSGVLGAVMAGVISYFVAKRTLAAQANIERQKLVASVVSTERLRWLKELRERSADFYTKMDMQLGHLERPVPQANPQALQEILDSYYEETVSLSHAIFLMLNKSKNHQGDLSTAVNDTLKFMQTQIKSKTLAPMSIDKHPYARLKTNAFNSLELIGAKAWSKVQHLE